MRCADGYNESLFSTVRLEEFVPANHPPQPIAVSGAGLAFCRTGSERVPLSGGQPYSGRSGGKRQDPPPAFPVDTE